MAKILLADDDFAVRDFVRRALEMDNHDIVSVHEGAEVMRRMNAIGEDYDLLLMDIQMPVIDGKRLAKKIKINKPHLPILLMTGYSSGEIERQQLSDNVVDILFKPFTLSAIRAAVDNAASGQRQFQFDKKICRK